MKAYKTPEMELCSIQSEDIMTISNENSYFNDEGTDGLVLNWGQLS